LLKREESGKDIKIELSKRDKDTDTDTESRNKSSKDGGGDGFRYFKNNTFLESDESRCRSEDYTDGSPMPVVALLRKMILPSSLNALYIAIYWLKRSRCTPTQRPTAPSNEPNLNI